MLFNSFEFVVFLPIVFICYWLLKSYKLQNILILVASYIFYGWWDWRFLLLIFISTLTDYGVGLMMGQTQEKKKRKLLLFLSLGVNLGMLGFFKYFNFFIGEFANLIGLLGMQSNLPSLNIILPVGISFYTFQTLSYSIDIYKGKLKPTKDAISFFTFVSFFPQLVAGPIERAKSLLPQFQKERHFRYEQAADGMKQMLWGFFKKIVIADNCAIYVNQIWETVYPGGPEINGAWYIIGLILFVFQIYADFSGYSDIAIGTAKLLGITLMTNFAYPLFSRNISEFWQRWHISLSAWFRDYVFNVIKAKWLRGKYRIFWKIMVVQVLIGFWHGASWSFILWGIYNGLLFIPRIFFKSSKRRKNFTFSQNLFPSFKEFFQMLGFFGILAIGGVLFRSNGIGDAWTYYLNSLTNFELDFFAEFRSVFKVFQVVVLKIDLGVLCLMLIYLLVIEWWNRSKPHGLDIRLPYQLNWIFYGLTYLFIMYFGNFNKVEFIYFFF